MIIYAPDGTPIWVFNRDVAKWYVDNYGFSFDPPIAEPEPEPEPSVDTETNDSLTININTATSSELIRLDHIGITKAKKIVELQPNIVSVNDLTQVLPDIDWNNLTVQNQPVAIVFDVFS